MAYINFKEENHVAMQQLKNRKENNDIILKKIQRDRTYLKDYSPYEKYSYKEFNNEVFGKQGVEDEQNFIKIEKKDIVCSKFTNCKFLNIKFKKCKFIGCTFENCDFLGGGVSFEGCTFVKADASGKPSLNKKDHFSCYFKGCKIYPEFLECDLSYTIFEDCLIKNAFFKKSDMIAVIIYNSELNMVDIQDSNLTGIKVVKTYIVDLEFTDKKRSKFDEKSYFDKIEIREGTKEEYEGVYTVYQSIANKFKENTLNNNFGEYYYLGKKTQRKALGFFPKVWSYLYFFTCGYGERPEYALYFSIVIMILFGFVYLITGIEIEGHNISYLNGSMNTVGLRKFLTYYNETLNLSIGMFAGVGFIKAEPDNISYTIANIEMIIGIVMMGVGIGTLTRKIVR